MATLLPALGACVSRMTAGERRLRSAHKENHAWGGMAILCQDWKTMDLCISEWGGDFNLAANTIQIMTLTMHASKGLAFPVVELHGAGHMPTAGDAEADAARVFYVAATQTKQRLVIEVEGGDFAKRLHCVSAQNAAVE